MARIPRRGRPLVLPGTLTVFRRRCGKPTCRCATGDPHESPALTYTEVGRTKTLTLSGADVAEVAAALARYDRSKADLELEADAGIAALRARFAARRGRR